MKNMNLPSIKLNIGVGVGGIIYCIFFL